MEAVRLEALGLIGIETTSPYAPLQVRSFLSLAGDTALSSAGAVLVSGTTNGGSSPSAAESALLLSRTGVSAQAYTNLAAFQLKRYVNSGFSAKTQLDIALNDDQDAQSYLSPIVSLRGDGSVGIGTTTPAYKLDVNGTSNFTSDSGISLSGSNYQNAYNIKRDVTTGYLFFQGNQATASGYQFNTQSVTGAMTVTGGGNVGIGTTSPNANAILDVSSTTMAFMPPRMTTTQRNAIASPTAGMVVYNATTNKLNVYTTAWEAVTSA